MKLLSFLAAGAMALAADPARVTYIKSFPGSNPPYMEITVTQAGETSYKEAVDEESPEKFQLEAEATKTMFGYADKLEHFKNPLESGLKVARLGEKTFRWENGAERFESKFNYSTELDAKALQDQFERIAETERFLAQLRRAARHDKLGVHGLLLEIQNSWNLKRLMGAAQFLPILDQVAKNESYLHMARERAAELSDAIRASAKPATP